jgi:hypothetical protein
VSLCGNRSQNASSVYGLLVQLGESLTRTEQTAGSNPPGVHCKFNREARTPTDNVAVEEDHHKASIARKTSSNLVK